MSENAQDTLASIENLRPWFHNLHLPGGIQTAPDHFLGDFPLRKWRQIEPHLPKNLLGWRCLDIGCNAGFYSFELAKRGASVLGIDSEPHYLSQARWVSKELQLSNPPQFVEMQIHDLAHLHEEFDLILFLGVLYHLRYPTLALDTISAKAKRLFILQTLTMNEEKARPYVFESEEDYPFTDRFVFRKSGWPKMSFVEKSFAGDDTNWWVPNHAAVLALLRSTGFQKIRRVAHEIYFCEVPEGGVMKHRTWSSQEWEAATGVKGR